MKETKTTQTEASNSDPQLKKIFFSNVDQCCLNILSHEIPEEIYNAYFNGTFEHESLIDLLPAEHHGAHIIFHDKHELILLKLIINDILK